MVGLAVYVVICFFEAVKLVEPWRSQNGPLEPLDLQMLFLTYAFRSVVQAPDHFILILLAGISPCLPLGNWPQLSKMFYMLPTRSHIHRKMLMVKELL